MKLLFDQNLSRTLVDALREVIPDCQHVIALGLDTATDREIWECARENDYVIVSKDSDSRQLAFLHGPPPKIVWLRVGNASTATALRVLTNHEAATEALTISDDEALLVLPGLPS